MLSSRCALTVCFWDTQQQLSAAAHSGMEKPEYKGTKGRTTGDGLLPPSASQSATYLLLAQSSCPLSPGWGSIIHSLPRVNKYKSAWGTLCSLENFTDHRVKTPCHPSLLIAAAEATWAPQDSTTSSLWMRALTLVCKRHLGGENTHREV